MCVCACASDYLYVSVPVFCVPMCACTFAHSIDKIDRQLTVTVMVVEAESVELKLNRARSVSGIICSEDRSGRRSTGG